MPTEYSIKKKLSSLLAQKSIDYQKVLELSSQLSKFDSEYLRFSVDANTISHLGRDSIKDHTTAVLELVKNSYDAFAKVVEIDIHQSENQSYIRIADDGIGMSESEILNNWLRIGYSDKKKNKVINGRRKTGEKGIGRLSADRLASKISLVSKKKSNKLCGIQIDWNIFNKVSKELNLIPIKKTAVTSINLPKQTTSEAGTEIILRDFRNVWKASDVERLIEELSILVSPLKGTEEFKIYLKTNVAEGIDGLVKPPKLLKPQVEVKVKYSGDGPFIEYKVKDKYGYNDKQFKKVSWKNLVTKEKDNETYLNDVKKYSVSQEQPLCGPLEFTLKFYPKKSAFANESGFSLSTLKQFLNYNSGVKIFRDKVSVQPYGFRGKAGADWLHLGERHSKNPAGISRRSWSVTHSQILGGVYITRDDNQNLTDSASREGLLHDDAYYDLRALVLCGIRILELHRYNLLKNDESSESAITESATEQEVVDHLAVKTNSARKSLKNLQELIKEHEEIDETVFEEFEDFFENLETTQNILKSLLDKNRTLGGLATIGIANAVFGHETQNSISQLILSLSEAKFSLTEEEPNIKEALKEIEASNKHSLNISNWGQFALKRIRRDKREIQEESIDGLARGVIEDIKLAFESRSIKLKTSIKSVRANVFAMDFESILMNLLTNSYAAVIDSTRSRAVSVSLKEKKLNSQKGYELSIGDSGNGIPEIFHNIVWEPLYTTKTDDKGNEIGTGLGLSIVNSIVTDLQGHKTIGEDNKLGGAKITIWLPNNLK